MPHAIIEYSANIAQDLIADQITPSVHQAMIASGLFQTDAIKTRSHPVTDFMVGAKGREGTFVYIMVALLAGRTPDQRHALSTAILAAIKPALSHIDQVTVEIRDMDRDTYLKL